MASSSPAARSIPFPPARVLLPILVLLGYAALLISGFGAGLGPVQPLPIYIYFSLLLLVLQAAISENRSLARLVYIFVTSGFAIVYGGEVIFGPRTGNFTRSPYTYIVLNTLLLAVFFYDAVDRRRSRPRGLDAKVDTAKAKWARISPLSYSAFGTDFAGMAILFFIAAFLVDLLGPENVPHLLGFSLGQQPYVIVDLNALLGLHLSSTLSHLESLDLVVAFGAAAASLLLLGLVGVVTISSPSEAAATRGETQGSSAVRRFGGSLQTIIDTALSEVLLSLRLVLGPLVWLIPAFSIAKFSVQVVTYLNRSASAPGTTIVDLFNPLSQTSRDSLGMGLATLALGIVAVAAVVAAVVVVEHDVTIVWRTLRIFRVLGRTLALTLAFFVYSLAALNAFAVLVSPKTPEPFQVGAPGLLTLLASGGFIFYAAIYEHFAAKTPKTQTPVKV